jgi:hypothetical protein
MVVISHTLQLAGKSLDFLAPLGLGNMGVMMFFILSGYVIAQRQEFYSICSHISSINRIFVFDDVNYRTGLDPVTQYRRYV